MKIIITDPNFIRIFFGIFLFSVYCGIVIDDDLVGRLAFSIMMMCAAIAVIIMFWAIGGTAFYLIGAFL